MELLLELVMLELNSLLGNGYMVVLIHPKILLTPIYSSPSFVELKPLFRLVFYLFPLKPQEELTLLIKLGLLS